MASRGKTIQLENMYVADFETCDAWPPASPDEIPNQRVWLAGHKNLSTLETKYFTSLDEFMKDILARKNNVNSEIAFHNLKFDGSYIVPWLLRNGYKVTQSKPKKGEFSVLIDERNAWYSITIQVTKKRRVVIWDSLKLFPCALEYLPDEYGTPTRKVQEDEEFYNQIRPMDHKPTERELKYLENDLQVLAETLRKHIEIYGLRFMKTQAGQAFYNFERTFSVWKMRFPPLDLEIDQKIRKGYWGGLAHVNKKYKEKDCFNIGVYDINSSYPYQLASRKMPFGYPIITEGPPDMSKFWVAEALVMFDLKLNCVPCIPTKAIIENKPITTEHWLEASNGVVRMVFCNIDYLTILESYNFKLIKWEWVIHWPWKVHRELRNFIYQNNEIKIKNKELAKKEKDPVLRQEYLTKSNRAKIDNNAFYGKFGEEIIKRGKTPYLEHGEVVYKCDRLEILSERKRRFLPLAIAVTAWGRRQLVQLANILGEHFLYCDTDSIHFLRDGGEEKIKKAVQEGILVIDDIRLGAWKHEGNFEWGRYLRPKCYMEGNPSKKYFEVTCAGLPADKHSGRGSKKRSCCTPENFYIGLVIPGGNGKLRTIRTPTGNKLVPVDYEIKETYSLFSG